MLGLITFCVLSCGGPSEKQAKEASDAAASDTSAATKTESVPPPPVSTIVTTPQNMMTVKHTVADFDKFLASYESHDSLRLANGIHSYVIGRGVQDPNVVLVAVKIDDIVKAKAFSKSAELKKAMQQAGVKGPPTIDFLTAVFQDTAAVSTAVRSRSKFKVKDWDTWQKSFESHRQIRIDNGVTDRVYGHAADDDKTVMVVVAVLDTAKANAFWKSDQLKQLRAESGAMGEPDRFLFTVVKRYH
ncbi:hypothetical protein FPE01S_04_01420 [Flavihumibacter petaseus NBRC 106054]|uniref:Uncharacterized protein n=2 Tax=Flavihumibacter TaxID=1004301 RepID=A0A0E9N502_9BACT|nr:hypothetical protein FPE01S_04_01420 [Flavihumibacter petaseus NBRC 106054]